MIMQITEKSTKSEIIDSAVELIDTQAEELKTLQSQQKALVTLLVVTTAWSLIF